MRTFLISKKDRGSAVSIREREKLEPPEICNDVLVPNRIYSYDSRERLEIEW